MYKVSVDFLTGSTLSFLVPFLCGGGGVGGVGGGWEMWLCLSCDILKFKLKSALENF